MKFVGRMLWLLIGLLWRLVVLVMFEKWVPFSDRPQAAPAPDARRAGPVEQDIEARGSAPKQRPSEPLRTPPSPFALERAQRAQQRRAQQVRAPFFPANSSERSPERAAPREGEHWLPPRSQVLLVRGLAQSDAPRARRASVRHETLASLLRDKGALRDAVVLGATLGARRPKL